MTTEQLDERIRMFHFLREHIELDGGAVLDNYQRVGTSLYVILSAEDSALNYDVVNFCNQIDLIITKLASGDISGDAAYLYEIK